MLQLPCLFLLLFDGPLLFVNLVLPLPQRVLYPLLLQLLRPLKALLNLHLNLNPPHLVEPRIGLLDVVLPAGEDLLLSLDQRGALPPLLEHHGHPLMQNPPVLLLSLKENDRASIRSVRSDLVIATLPPRLLLLIHPQL